MVSVKEIKSGKKLSLVDALSVSKLAYFKTPGEVVRAHLSILCSTWAEDFPIYV